MRWFFWLLLIIALVLLISPLLGVVTAALRATFSILGTLLLIAVIIWAIVAISRATRRSAPGQPL